MRRSALTLSLIGLGMGLSGCGLFKKKNPEPVTTNEFNEPVRMSDTSYPTDSVYTAPISSATANKFHTVQKKETLFSLARSYYNDQSKWRVIYDANRADIGEDPNRIRVGQKLMIP